MRLRVVLMSRMLRRVRSSAAENAEHGVEQAGRHPERLGDISAIAGGRQGVVPVVHRLVAGKHREAELGCRVRRP